MNTFIHDAAKRNNDQHYWHSVGNYLHQSHCKSSVTKPTKVLVPWGAAGWAPLTWEGEEAAVNRAGDGLELDHVHGLADVHRAGHAAQGAPHKLRHLLHREHLQQLVEDGGKRVQQGGLQAQEGAQHLPCPACSSVLDDRNNGNTEWRVCTKLLQSGLWLVLVVCATRSSQGTSHM